MPFLFSIDEYQILNELGSGSFGVVYLAHDTKLNRRVAIKKLKVGPEAGVDELTRFRGEAETLGSIQHPNIVQIYDTGTHQGSPYLVMEYVDGGTLAKQLHGEPRQPRQAAELIETLARAIQVAHDRGVIHRDLKPGNVLLQKPSLRDSNDADAPARPGACIGIPKIADFGLAKRLDSSQHLTRTGAAVGTPSYMAPEQARGDRQIGPETDVYALGAILYELLTGRPPFCGPDLFEVIAQVRSVEPLSPSRLVPKLPRDLTTICLKCLEKSPAKRYRTALELAEDLRRYLDGNEILARPTSRLERFWRAIRRHPLQAAVIALSLSLVGLIGWMIVQRYVQLNQAIIARLEEEKKAAEKRLVEGEYAHSLEALTEILELIGEGSELHKIPQIAPLHNTLLTYYERLIERQEGNAMAPRDRLADACVNLGGLIKATGKLEDAGKAFDKAIDLYKRLLDETTNSQGLRRKYAMALLERARIHDERGEEKPALRDAGEARDVLVKLSEEMPSHENHRRDLSNVWHWLGVIKSRNPSTHQKALESYHKSLELRQKLSNVQSDNETLWFKDQRELARTHGYLGDLLLESGEISKADATYWRSHRIREEVAQRTKLSEDRFQLARSWANFAGLQTRVRAHVTAIDFWLKSLEERRKLVEENPANSEYKRDLAECNNNVAELLLLGTPTPEQFDEAERYLSSALNLFKAEHDKDRHTVPVNTGLATNLALRARLHLIQNKVREAATELAQARTLLHEALQKRDAADLHYQLAAVNAMFAELEPPDTREPSVRDAVEKLKHAMNQRFRRLHRQDVRQDRAFLSCRNHEAFLALFESKS